MLCFKNSPISRKGEIWLLEERVKLSEELSRLADKIEDNKTTCMELEMQRKVPDAK